MQIQSIAGVMSVCALMFYTLPAEAALVSRLDGQAYYDDVLDVTWLADANLAASSSFGLAYNADLGDYAGDPYGTSYIEAIQTDGRMTWGGALHWIDAINANGGTGYLGFSDWRMPTMLDTGTMGCNLAYGGSDCGYNVQTGTAATTVYSEMASLWYDTLGNTANYDSSGNAQPGGGLTNTGPFSNVQPYYYWTGLEDASSTDRAWYFSANDGIQGAGVKNLLFYGLVVRSGDVSAVPTPAAVWLFGSGLLGLLGIARKEA